MIDLIKNLQINCPENHFIKLVTLKDDVKFKIRKNDVVRSKDDLICLHTSSGLVSCVVNKDYIVAVCYCKELPKNE